MTERDFKDILELCEVRAGLEAAAARSLAAVIMPEQVAHLRQLARAADHAEEFATARVEWDRAEEAFHHHLVESAGNAHILRLLEHQGLLEKIITFPLPNWRQAPRFDAPRHLDIVDALASCDPDYCDRLVRAHIGVRMQMIVECMSQRPVRTDD